jgi:hypothetical protein
MTGCCDGLRTRPVKRYVAAEVAPVRVAAHINPD